MDLAAEASSDVVVKDKQAKPLNSSESRIIWNVFNKFSEEHPSLTVSENKQKKVNL